MVDIEKKLTEHLQKINTAPFLFVGSGFSRRYLGLEDWKGLMERFSDLVPKEFDYYSSTSSNDWAKAAEMMAEDFHPIWWNDDSYKDSREEFKGRINSIFSPLKIEVAKYLRDIKYEEGQDQNTDKEIEALKNVVIDGIITTNWDMLLEQIFSAHDMEVYIGQKELMFSQPLEVNEIYKIHGCSSVPDSLVLTEDDYEDFNDKNAYLAAKLLTIFIEHPVVFIGYSLADNNINKILQSITYCLDESNIDKLKDRLIFIERAQEEPDSFLPSSLTVNQLTIPITRVKTNQYDLVYKALSKNKRKFSMKMMRNIKSQIYELVKTNEPGERVHVVDYEDSETAEELEFVIGLGVKAVAEKMDFEKESSASREFGKTGYRTLTQHDIFREVLSETAGYNYNYIVEETLPQLLKIYHTLPVNKFVNLSGVDHEDLDEKILKRLMLTYEDFLTKAQSKEVNDLSFEWQFSNIREIQEGYKDFEIVIQKIPLLGKEKLDVDELEEFLLENVSHISLPGNEGANMRRLVRIYDWLKYRT